MNELDPKAVATHALLEAALAATRTDPSCESESRWGFIRALHGRTDRAIFDRAAAWCVSHDALERTLGADVLAQLGRGPESAAMPFAADSEPLLINLLVDSDERVVMSALYALGHLGVGDSEALGRCSAHESADVRHALAYALGGRVDAESIQSLISLSSDDDDEVRDWATFGLGTLCDIDNADVRGALFARLSDANAQTRREAVIGLAKRGDRRVVPEIVAALRSGSTDGPVWESARALSDACPDESELRSLVVTE